VLLVGGFYLTSFAPPRKTVAKIGDETVQLRDVAAHTRLINGFTGQVDPENALNLMVRNEVLRQFSGPSLQIALPSNDVDEAMIRRFETPNEEGVFPPLMTAIGQERFQDFKDAFSVDSEELRGFEEGELLIRTVENVMALLVPSPQSQVFLHWIVVGTPAEGDTVLARLTGGEVFEEVAAEVNQELFLADANGEVGWMPAKVFPEFDAVFFNAELEEFIGPLNTSIGTMIAKITQGPEVQDLSDEMIDLLAAANRDMWVQSRIDEAVTDFNFDRDDLIWVLDHLN
jgi:hypothetical protein